LNPQNTIFNFKRLIGRRFSDPLLQEYISTLPFKIEQGPGDKPIITVECAHRVLKYYPEEIYSILIQKLKSDAESYMKQTITDVVVTVPTYYNRL
jgi:L1 cell adhesion molecule like protein